MDFKKYKDQRVPNTVHVTRYTALTITRYQYSLICLLSSLFQIQHYMRIPRYLTFVFFIYKFDLYYVFVGGGWPVAVQEFSAPADFFSAPLCFRKYC